jgi:PKD repeat protein
MMILSISQGLSDSNDARKDTTLTDMNQPLDSEDFNPVANLVEQQKKYPYPESSSSWIPQEDNIKIPYEKIEPSLLYSLKESNTVRVVITAIDMEEVRELLGLDNQGQYWEKKDFGSRMQTSALEVPSHMVPQIAALQGVIHIQGYHLPTPPVFPEGMDITDWDYETEPTMWNAVKYHWADNAWNLGFNGSGVNVAVMDTGVDFGHPDLNGTQARDENPSSPYYGWPLAFDSRSMNSYLNSDGQGFTGAGGENNWFSDTTTTDTDSDGNGTLDNLGFNVTNITSQSGIYHLGRHPDTRLRNIYGQYVRILVVDENIAGVYDTVYVNLDNDNNFTDEKPCRKGDETPQHDLGADGIPDRSGGLIYFIADGINPVPYSDIIASENGQNLPIPAPGDLVAFMINDPTEAGGNHGTLCASAVAGQGVIASGRVTGTAPNAKIISIGNIYQGGNDFDSYYFAVEGYDGIPGTGDEAQIVSCSFGDSNVVSQGWDFTGRFLDNLTTYYAPNVTFSVASGNGGYGYGTVVSPGSSMGVVTVGAALNAKTTEVVYWSNRGPNAVGQVDPDVVAVGVGAFGDQALNQKNNGNSAYQSWSGTSLATPVAAGILALVYDAYDQANGEFPSSELTREIIMSSADNLNYDPLVQGAGFCNATRAVMVANDTSGLLLSPTFWTAGDYRGVDYEGFAKILHPGDSDNITFSVTNKNQNKTLDTEISDYILTRTETHTAIFNSNKSELDGNNNRPDFFVTLHDSVNNISHIPNDTALLKVWGFMSYDEFDKDMNYNHENRFTITIYNWRDANGNGSYWNDTNSDGVSQIGEIEWNELSAIVSSGIVATTQEARMHDPLTRTTDGLVVGVFHRPGGAAVQFTDIYIQSQCYNRTDWDWLDTSSSGLSIGADSTSLFSATLSVPPSTPIGVYEGMIVINESKNETAIPVIVNVAGNSERFTFGGNLLSTELYANDQVFGAFRWGWRYEGGDWRFYFTDIPDSFGIKPGTKLIANVNWDNYPTDIDVYLLGGVDDQFSDETPGHFGPHTMAVTGSSADQYIWAGKFRFNTTTGSTQEIIAADLSPGLNEIILHNVLYSGAWFAENVSAEVGTINVTPYPWDVGFIDSMDDLSHTQMFTLLSSFNLTGISAEAIGVYPPMDFPDQLVYQNVPTDKTTSNWSVEFDVSNAQYIKVNTSSEHSMDIDLFLLEDDGDGIPEWGGEQVASSTTPYADEEIIYNLPADGKYWVFVHGWNIPVSPSTFDCFIEVVSGNNMNTTDVPSGPITKDVLVTFNSSVSLPPQAGEHRGIITVSLDGLYETIEIPFEAELESEKPFIYNLVPTQGTWVNLSQPFISAQYDDTGSGINSSAVYIFLDGIDHTANATITNNSISLIPPVSIAEGIHTVFLIVTDNFQNTENVTWTFYVDSKDPVAVAGDDQVLIEDEIVYFNGSLSTDENELFNYTWDFGDGNFGYGPNPEHSYPSAATYIVILTVRDIANNSLSDSLNVFVDNVAPFANAGTDQSVLEGDSVFFDASSSTDTPSDIPKLIYYWYFEDGTVLSGISVNHVFLDDGIYTVTLVVEDDNGFTDSTTLNVTVFNVAPVADIGGPYSGDEGSEIQFSGSASDSGDDSFTFEWDFDNGGLYDDAVGEDPTWTWYDEGNYLVKLKVTDDDGDSAYDSILVAVNNVAPIADIGGPYMGLEGTSVSLIGSGSDPGTDTLSYAWDLDFDGQYDDYTDSDPQWTWADDGIYIVGLMVSDGDGGEGFDTTSVSIENLPPIVDAHGPYSDYYEGEEISFFSDVNDLGSEDIFTYLWDFGDGKVSTLSNPTHVYDDNGEYTVTLTVSDDDGGIGTNITLATIINQNPTIEDVDEIYYATEDQTFSLQINAEDASGDILTFSDESDLFEIDSKNGLIEFTPKNQDVGNYIVRVWVNDDDGGKTLLGFFLTVEDVNDPPTLDDIGSQVAFEDETFILAVLAYDPDSDEKLTYSDDSHIFTINSKTGIISFVPTNEDVGQEIITVTVSDSKEAEDQKTFLLTIKNINDAPELAVIPNRVTEAKSEFTLTITASDDDDAMLIYSDDSDMFSIDPVTGKISFIPENKDAGIHEINITVTDASGASDTETMKLTIVAADEPDPTPPWLSIILFILIIALFILLIIHLLLHKKDQEEEMETKEGESGTEPEDETKDDKEMEDTKSEDGEGEDPPIFSDQKGKAKSSSDPDDESL